MAASMLLLSGQALIPLFILSDTRSVASMKIQHYGRNPLFSSHYLNLSGMQNSNLRLNNVQFALNLRAKNEKEQVEKHAKIFRDYSNAILTN